MIMLRLCYIFFMEKKEGGENENFEKKKKTAESDEILTTCRKFRLTKIFPDKVFCRQGN